jgi:hypothetical protein
MEQSSEVVVVKKKEKEMYSYIPEREQSHNFFF